MNAYLLTFAVLLITTGRLGDLYGRKAMFMAGLSVFTLASLACGLAPSIGFLIAFRAVQGVGRRHDDAQHPLHHLQRLPA